MTILEELKQYCNNCLEDKYISEYEQAIRKEIINSWSHNNKNL